MIKAIIFSKDRACQLHALLRSIAQRFNCFSEILVIYKATTRPFQDAYNDLWHASYHKTKPWSQQMKVGLKYEKDIKSDFVSALQTGHHLVCILTDDSIIYKSPLSKLRWEEAIGRQFNMHNDLFCFSLRYGQNTLVQNYATGEMQEPYHDMIPDDGHEIMSMWNWAQLNPLKNFGYPIGMDGHIYRTVDILPITQELNFNTLRGWEGTLALDWRNRFEDKPLMASYKQSILVNIPTNNVQVPPIPSGPKYAISVEELNDRFLSGQMIDIDKTDFSNIVGSHQEIELKFCQRWAN